MDPLDDAIMNEIKKFPEIYSTKKCSLNELDQIYQQIAANLVKKKGIFKFLTGNTQKKDQRNEDPKQQNFRILNLLLI